tara:strand:+ start:95 stop:271 length:177 start_codon:yes stop_codon:yes gene_type:complete
MSSYPRASVRARASRGADNASTGNKQYGLAPRIGASVFSLRLFSCCGQGGNGKTIQKK